MATTTVCNDASRCSLAGLVTNCCRVSLSLRSVMTVAKKGVGRLGPREEGATALVVTYSSRRWCHSCRTEVRRDYGGRRKAVTQGLLCTFLSYGVLISEELSFCVCGCVRVCVNVIAYVDMRRVGDSRSRKRYDSFCVESEIISGAPAVTWLRHFIFLPSYRASLCQICSSMKCH